ncbi:hypothetical protein DFP72DRAFT_1077405 [Ephemerocybe angulata]|uniref:Uncharacterized protein n=1 Tax=Ephemerocybe angulata TaxID=980116 RepID=A0A8H6LYV1_9AGAR|nr:hypothetical protein DFP72DRAFT_1077405 [Tulosesus angulatus]
MQFTSLLRFTIATIVASQLPIAVSAAEGDVLTATKVFQTIVSESPFLVTRSTIVTWTQSASITESTSITPIPESIETAPATAQVEI